MNSKAAGSRVKRTQTSLRIGPDPICGGESVTQRPVGQSNGPKQTPTRVAAALVQNQLCTISQSLKKPRNQSDLNGCCFGTRNRGGARPGGSERTIFPPTNRAIPSFR